MSQAKRYSCAALAVVTVSLASCSAFRPRQTESDVIEDQTSSIVSEIEFGMEMVEPVALIRYLTGEPIPEVEAFARRWDQLRESLRALLSYSVALADIEDQPNERAAIEVLADSLEQLYASIRPHSELAPQIAGFDLDATLDVVRSQSDLLDAAQKTLPAVDRVIDALQELTHSTGRSMDEAAAALLVVIDSNHEEVLRFQDTLALRRNDTLRQLEWLDRAIRLGEAEAWSALQQSDSQMSRELKDVGPGDLDAARLVEERLLRQLETVERMRISMDHDFELYNREVVELRQVRRSVDESLAVARLALESWEGGHRRFVTGRKSSFARMTRALMIYAARRTAKTWF